MILQRLFSQWRKGSPQNPSSGNGAAYRADGSWLRVHISNLSYDGCLVLSMHPLDIGEVITLVIPRANHIRGEVCWSEGPKKGVRFSSTSNMHERRAQFGI